MKFKILIAGVLLVICSGSAFAAVPVLSVPARVPTYMDLVTATAQTLLTATVGKTAVISGVIVSAVADSVVTITDRAGTTLTTIRCPAKETVVVPFDVAIPGTRSTSTTLNVSLKVKSDVATAVEITAFGFEK